jgi:tetratricopeptide (TPR) repeat protein/transcriptional regulator with XRE-family HTH domain
MKKAAVARPNVRLREARELRGWSQKYVAEQIGADRYYLSRWEHGTAFPSPYYRQKLCKLFGKDTRELGLLPEESAKASSEQAELEKDQQKVSEVAAAQEGNVFTPASGPIHDPTLPPPMAEIAKPVGRDEVLRRLRQQLCSGKGVVLTAINGLPGVGKTTLAIELAHDEQVLAQFPDGVLWSGLGPTPDMFAILNHWGTLLGVSTLQAAKLKTVEDWSKALHALIGQQRLLLVIDDAWRIEAALAFKVGGPHCAYVLTTRFPNIAQLFTLEAGEAVVLHELNTEDGLALLARLAPEVVRSETEGARALVEAVGGLPLALTLIGRYLRSQVYAGQPRRIRSALERLRTTGERLRLTGALAPLERPPSLGPAAPLSLQTVIAVSDQHLEEQEQAALRALAVFPAKPNSFSEEAALAVSDAPVEVLDALSDAGLLESSGPGRYALHQVITDYARTHLDDTRVYERMAEYFASYVREHKKEYDLLEQEANNIFAALDAAYEYDYHASMVRCVNALFPFLFARGFYAQHASIYIERAVEVARRLNDDALLAEALIHQGKAAYKQGNYGKAEVALQEARECAGRVGDPHVLSDALLALGILARFRVSYDQAETYLQESLTLARQANDPDLLSDVLSHLGSAFSDQGRYAEAETYNREGLALARSIGDREGIAQMLINLSSIAILKGEFALGEAYGQEALALAREIGFLDSICVVCTNLGNLAIERKDYAKAEAYLTEALEVARRIEDTKVISADLGTLGSLAVLQGHDALGEAYLKEALEVARRVGDIWLLGAVLLECGELYLKQQRLDEAYAAFQEALTISSKSNQETIASALYGLARVAAARGELAEARRQGQQSYDIFESMGNRMRDTVKAWVQALPEEK